MADDDTLMYPHRALFTTMLGPISDAEVKDFLSVADTTLDEAMHVMEYEEPSLWRWLETNRDIGRVYTATLFMLDNAVRSSHSPSEVVNRMAPVLSRYSWLMAREGSRYGRESVAKVAPLPAAFASLE